MSRRCVLRLCHQLSAEVFPRFLPFTTWKALGLGYHVAHNPKAAVIHQVQLYSVPYLDHFFFLYSPLPTHRLQYPGGKGEQLSEASRADSTGPLPLYDSNYTLHEGFSTRSFTTWTLHLDHTSRWVCGVVQVESRFSAPRSPTLLACCSILLSLRSALSRVAMFRDLLYQIY